MSQLEFDYSEEEVPLSNQFCTDCGKQLNETEISESERHITGEKVFCTFHLNYILEGIKIESGFKVEE